MAEQGFRLAVALNSYGLVDRHAGGDVRDVLPWHELLLIAETAEETGYEAIFTPEIRAREAFATLAALADATREVRLASGVVPIHSRAVATMALGAATLQDISDGRFVLGLGSSESVDDTRAYVRAVRELLNDDPATPPGAGGGADDLQPVDLARAGGLEVPIFLAALGPRMTTLAGEVADGVVLNWCTPERVAAARRQVAEGAGRAGRDPRKVAVAVYVRACLGHDQEHAVAALRDAAGQYAAMDTYRRQFEAMGLGPEAAAAAGAWGAGRPGEVPPALLRACCVWGTREEGLEGLAAYREAGADLVVVYPVPAQEAASSIMGTVLAAAPNPAVEA
jgi:alkanesulfonate monooxygenase SsuD/methylene tetrahydromethanopterin reductase-like flavin-dependent oxidoreductase (luciferase family)